jgi:hypothetical protein
MDLLPLSPNDFKFCFTLFPKYFSSFVHTTCSLSVSVQYLAFAEVHLRVCAALSNCTTLGPRSVVDLDGGQERDDTPPWCSFSGGFFHQTKILGKKVLHYNSTASDSFHGGFKHRLSPVHSPLLRGSQLFSFPPLSDMLKFSGSSCTAEVALKKMHAS